MKQSELCQEFTSFYGAEFLKVMDSSIDNDNEYNWLRVITRDLKRTVHTVRHLLLIYFLTGDIAGFFCIRNTQLQHLREGALALLK
ncbi:TnsD family Tn7-like transposition protein [Clostridium estertheticum]|uniref:TnsD family Tn7-like transposition protein n=1 Tax=Clostridium estertheticum TaxID=238834 RepID=UPI00398C7D74